MKDATLQWSPWVLVTCGQTPKGVGPVQPCVGEKTMLTGRKEKAVLLDIGVEDHVYHLPDHRQSPVFPQRKWFISVLF